MRFPAAGCQLLGLIAIVATQSVSSWFCTAEQAFCQVPSAKSSSGAHADCCDKGSWREEEAPAPCCVEVSPDWQALPGVSGVAPPDPLLLADRVYLSSLDFVAPALILRSTSPIDGIGGPDPPDVRVPSLQVDFCVRLI